MSILGTEEQVPRIQEWLTKNKYFLGGAVNRELPRNLCARSSFADQPSTCSARLGSARLAAPYRPEQDHLQRQEDLLDGLKDLRRYVRRARPDLSARFC